MTQVTIIDGIGQTHTRVYASVGALPAPALGAFAIVDGGTRGVLYIGVHDVLGALSWVRLLDLLDAILRNPSTLANVITDTTPGRPGLKIQTAADGLDVRAPGAVIVGEQDGSTPANAILDLIRDIATAAVPIAQASPDGSTEVPFVNGFAEISARTYTTLPTATTDHLGAIVRLIGVSSTQDTFWMCVLDASSSPVWTQFIGPTGATGPAGPTGPEGPTGPAGPAGTIDLPALPSTEVLDFAMIVLAQGTDLPWIVPANYAIQAVSSKGIWTAVGSDVNRYHTPYTGSPTHNEGNGIPTARLTFERIDLNSDLREISSDAPVDATVPLTITADSAIAMAANCENQFNSTGWILATIRVTPPALNTTTHVFDFTTGEHGWTRVDGDNPTNLTVYVPATGWQAYWVYIGLHLDENVSIVGMKVYSDHVTDVRFVGSTNQDTGGTQVFNVPEHDVGHQPSFGGSLYAMVSGDYIMVWSEDGDGAHPVLFTRVDVTVLGLVDPFTDL